MLQALRPKPWIAQLCPVQRRVHASKSRWKSLTTSRRGGKTVLLVALAAESLEESTRGEVTLFISKTRQSAKELCWDALIALNEQYKLGWSFNATTLRIETPRGGALLVRGAEGSDAERERQKLRGLKCRRILLDETQSYAATLRRLLRDTLEPALGDLRGDLIVAGTPGEVKSGGWFHVSHGKHDGAESKWERFHWTVRDNTFFKDAEEYLAQALVDNGWTEESPTFQREYLGIWADDESVQVYRYLSSRDDVQSVDGYSLEWPHGIGQDFGQDDACAWTLLTNRPNTKEVYGMLSFKLGGLSPDECADLTGYLVNKTNPDILTGDGGNLGGNIYIQAINERLGERTGQRMVSAQKSEKRAYIELFNGDIRSGRFKFCKGPLLWLAEDESAPQVLRDAALLGCEPWTEEMETLPWANEAKLREHAGHANHCCDSGLYNWRMFSAYLNDSVPVNPWRTPVPGEAAYEQWLIEQEEQQSREQSERPWWRT